MKQLAVRDRNAEARIQAAIVAWIRTVAPQVIVFAVPNGGLRSKAEAARMKWTGTLAGVPDLCIVAPPGRVRFIEVKAPGGALTESQRELFPWLGELGCQPHVCRSVEDARAAFEAWEIPTREAGKVRETWHRYVPVGDVPRRSEEGWIPESGPPMHPPHGHYSVLMTWGGEGEPPQ